LNINHGNTRILCRRHVGSALIASCYLMVFAIAKLNLTEYQCLHSLLYFIAIWYLLALNQ
jgi:hypothetical protein